MNASSKNKQKTRIQLEKELAEAINSNKTLKSELRKLQDDMENMKHQFKAMKENMEELKQSRVQIEQENEELKKKVTTTTESNSYSNTEIGNEFSSNTNPPQKSGIEIQNLTEDNAEEDSEKLFSGDLTSSLPYLPAKEEYEPEIRPEPVHKKTEISEIEGNNNVIQVSAKVTKKVIEDIRLAQRGSSHQSNKILNADEPIVIQSKIMLPLAPSKQNVDIDTPNYGLRIVISEKQSNTNILTKEIAYDLIFGVANYENFIEIPALESGIYDLNFGAIVPFIHIAEEKKIAFTVGS